MKHASKTLTALALAAVVLVAGCTQKTETAGVAPKAEAQVTGAGASFIYPLMAQWSSDYRAATGNKINYQSIGSGGGIAQIKAGTVDFGSSDKPLSSEELAAANLAQFPSAIGGVVPVINLTGFESAGKLRLTGSVLAEIYMGKITQWNDPKIAALNVGATLPAEKINVVRRSDGSGTTFNFTNYLSKVSPEFKAAVGEGTSVNWTSGIGGKGNEGVASYVKQMKQSIGYVELSYALQNKMSYATLQNAAGAWVQPNAASFAAAAASADWQNAKDFNLVITNASGQDAWPIAASNFMIMQKHPKNPAARAAALDFFKWAFEKGQKQAEALDYVPLPPALVQQIEASWAVNFK
ncbi:phosphate ABC transporter substrate-binding protein PstS [Lysobacter sp. HDW10]|uniref:phosphate ABC transporter substrate-binding protein PstS n=1 Tax=Lysobacter sp. HDW10 TaxID=2714936 RepID=UPI00140E09EC|nr:phosphate ABC transporter substrate-binding protein PstS [Lysobacter sp. HDW10]QIK80145.1 phosphate ABC transporter substrate-binding protein PstS [Lysobacter sp. HDW10]